MKSQFLNRLQNLKHNGKQISIMTRVASYLDREFEKNYMPDPKKSEKENKRMRDAMYSKLYERAEQIFRTKG